MAAFICIADEALVTHLQNAIAVDGLTKYYGKLLAVDHINFNVEQDSIFGLLGPNGAGKSTTVRMLAGLTKPSEGKAIVLGFDVTHEIIRAKQRIGIVPELSNIYDEMTALENLVFAGELYGVPRQERESRARELLELFGLSNRATDSVGALSKGMKRRLTMACALVHKPKLLFLDEPTTGLDVQSARLVRELIRGLNKDGVTVFLTTHYIEEADQLCDQIAIINRGKIVALGSPEKLKARIKGVKVVEVSFSKTLANMESELQHISSVDEIHKFGDKFRVFAKESADIVADLVDYARTRGLVVASINTVKPSLEEAFIKTTGLDSETMMTEKEQIKPERGGRSGKELG